MPLSPEIEAVSVVFVCQICLRDRFNLAWLWAEMKVSRSKINKVLKGLDLIMASSKW